MTPDLLCLVIGARPTKSYASGSAEADLNLLLLHNHGYLAGAFAVFQHSLEAGRIGQHVDVLERYLSLLIVRTGCCGIRSRIFAENEDRLVRHYENLLKNKGRGSKDRDLP